MSQDRMEVEFRPDGQPDPTILDEVVITGAHTFHAEMMGDDHLWIGISNEAGHLVHVNVRVERKGRKAAIVMRGAEQARPDPASRTEI